MGRDIANAQIWGANYIHVDIMDGRFVKQFGFNTLWINAIQKYTDLPIDVHLMTYDTLPLIPHFVESGVNSILFHIESDQDCVNTIQQIRKWNIKAGIVISPDTNPEELLDYIPFCDEILVMSVHPGEAGSAFLQQTPDRIGKVRDMIQTCHSQAIISVDGGIKPENAIECILAGAQKIVMGTGFFKSENPSQITKMIASY